MSKEKETSKDENIEKDENIISNEEINTETENTDNQEEKTLEQEYNELKDRNLRLFAEFENFKKRTSKERLELYKTANQSLLVDLLPVLDDFDRGINQLKKDDSDNEALKGMELIHQKFINILNNKGLKAMESSVGDDFDLEKHEAITQIPAPSEDLKGKIVDVIETGYTLSDKVIRYAKVVVGK